MKAFKYFEAFAVAILAISITSCGSKSGSKGDDSTCEVTVDNTTIGGKLSQYFSLVDKTYKYKKDNLIDEVIVELKCIEPLPENLEAYIGIEVLDENGNVIAVEIPDGNSFCDYELLQQANPDQIVTVTIKNYNEVGKEKPAKIRLSSKVSEKEESDDTDDTSDEDSYSSSDSDDDSSASLSSGSEDWDAMLDSYDSYVTKYVSLTKKAMKGDLLALAEYPALLEKAQDLCTKMEKAQGELSPSQLSRYLKITTKMTEALVNMK